MALITTSDIEGRWRPLTSEESTVAATLIADVEAWASLEVPSYDANAASPPSVAWTQNAKRIFATAVVRVLKNPAAYRSESDGDYSYSFDRVLSSGELYLSPGDRRQLANVRSRFYSSSVADEGINYVGGLPPTSWELET